jgi:thymidylate synthase ThyX
MIEASVVKDSVSPAGKRITTLQLKYPRFIHSEVMTHRAFSRNASSSRAIPVSAQLKSIKKDMAAPIHWGANKPGMQADKELSRFKIFLAKSLWTLAGRSACFFAGLMNKLGAHKQVVNRITEPFSYISVVLTATEFDNFFALRYHHMAQPEIYELAKKMYQAYSSSTPKQLELGQWHLPYVSEEEVAEMDIEMALKCSVARCARVSYNNHDGTKPVIKKDLELYDRLLGHHPVHASPAEHQATPYKTKGKASGNLVGWRQYRKTIANENITTFVEETNEPRK